MFNMRPSYVLLLLVCASCNTFAKDKKLAKISYTLWINNEIDEVHNIYVKAPVNTTFYNVMEIAARHHSQYVFQAKLYDFGHYITDIGGHHENTEERVFWLIYQTPKIPSSKNPPSDELLTKNGVDYIHIQDGDHYLFWYKKL